jgi:hypothetical protein
MSDVLLFFRVIPRDAVYSTDRDADNWFSFEDRRLDHTFSHRYADPAVAPYLRTSAVRDALRAFVVRWHKELWGMTVSSSGVKCMPLVGSSKRSHSITPQQLRVWLPALLELTRTIDDALADARLEEK